MNKSLWLIHNTAQPYCLRLGLLRYCDYHIHIMVFTNCSKVLWYIMSKNHDNFMISVLKSPCLNESVDKGENRTLTRKTASFIIQKYKNSVYFYCIWYSWCPIYKRIGSVQWIGWSESQISPHLLEANSWVITVNLLLMSLIIATE